LRLSVALRRLPAALAARGLNVRVRLLNTLTPDPARFTLLRGLPLTPEERARLDHIEAAARDLDQPWGQVCHLPFFLVVASKP
jgi:hypothetical protein